MGRILNYLLVGAAAFYIGNVAPIHLPNYNDVMESFNNTKKKIVEVKDKINMPSIDISRIEGEKDRLENRVKELEGKLKNFAEQKKKEYPINADNPVINEQKEPDRTQDNQYPQEKIQISPLEQYMIELVNKMRKLNGVPELRYDNPKLFTVARQHSREMMELGYFEHESPVEGYKELEDRFEKVGILPISKSATGWTEISENISYSGACSDDYGKGMVEISMFGGRLMGIDEKGSAPIMYIIPLKEGNCTVGDEYSGSMEEIGGLVGSKGHRKNMLDPDVRYIGIGITTGIGKFPNGTTGPGIWVTQNFAKIEER